MTGVSHHTDNAGSAECTGSARTINSDMRDGSAYEHLSVRDNEEVKICSRNKNVKISTRTMFKKHTERPSTIVYLFPCMRISICASKRNAFRCRAVSPFPHCYVHCFSVSETGLPALFPPLLNCLRHSPDEGSSVNRNA